MLDTVVRLLDDVIGHSITETLTRMEEAHTRDLTTLTQVFECLFERQEARHRESLECLFERQEARHRESLKRQDACLHEILERHTRTHADELRTILQETAAQHPAVTHPTDEPTATAALEELQETLRLGFGEVRGSLDRHHHELMNAVRADLRPLAQAALARLCAPEPPSPEIPGEPAVPTPQPRPRAGPARPAPTRDEFESMSRRRHAALDDDEEDGLDGEALDDFEDPRRRRLHYPRPDDNDAELSCRPKAGP